MAVPAHLDGHFAVLAGLKEVVHWAVTAASDQGVLAPIHYFARKVFDVVGIISELQPEDILAGAVGGQGTRDLAAAHEAVLPGQHHHLAAHQLPTDMHQISCYFHQSSQPAVALGSQTCHWTHSGWSSDHTSWRQSSCWHPGWRWWMETSQGRPASNIWPNGCRRCAFYVRPSLSSWKVSWLVPTGQQFCTLVRRHAGLLSASWSWTWGQLRSRVKTSSLPSLVAWTSLNVMAPDTGPRSRRRPLGQDGPESWMGQRAWAAQVGLRLSVGSSRLPSRNAGPGKTRRWAGGSCRAGGSALHLEDQLPAQVCIVLAAWAEKAAESTGPWVFAGQVVILVCCQVAAQVLHGHPAALPAWSEGYFKCPEQLPLQTAGPQVHLESRLLGLGCLLQLTRPSWVCSASVVLWEGLLATRPGSLGMALLFRLASIAMGHTLRGPP